MKHFNFIKGFLLALMFVCAAQVKADENILVNGGFEEWSAGALTAWGKDGSNASAHSATIAQSTDACSGSYAVEVSGNSSGNKRLASKAYTLAAGTYTLSAYIKQSGEAAGKFRLGYAVIENGAIDSQNGYFYLTEATDATSDWECHSAEFTLEEETTVSILVMNNKLGKGASFLVDDVVVTGGNGETPGQPEEPEEPETPVEPETPAGVYISEALTSSFGTFTTQETVGNYPWEIATQYQCAKVTGYKGSANAAESWMVSKSFDLSKETAAYISFDYVIAYNSDDINGCHKVVFSHDYAGDVSKATWKEIDYSPVKSGVWTLENTGKIAIPSEMYGKDNVVVAFKYTSSASNASTWEVANVVVASGTGNAPEQPEEPETPETLVCTVTEALAAFVAGEAKPAVVKGYIVGTINGQVYAEGCVFSGIAESKTNLLIADNVDETDPANCMPVQLPSGAVRNALNLVDNAGNYKKQVTLTGSLEKYFGVPGLKTVSKYEIEGVTPDEPETPEGAYINETFATDFGAFTTQETVGNYPWIIDYSTAKATSYIDTDGDGKADTNKEATSWLVSPTIDLTNETEAYIAFEYIIRYAESGKVADNHQLLICNDFSGDVATASWVNIPYGAVEGVDWNTFYKANVAVPADFLGKSTVTLALRYTATTKAGTWEVKNFVVAHGAATGETPEEPETPDTPDTPVVPSGDNLLANGGFEEWNGDAPAAWGTGNIGHNATISQSTTAYAGSYAVSVSGSATANKRLGSQKYTLAAGTYTLGAYIKHEGATAAAFKLGYGIIKNGAIANADYKYQATETYTTADWTLYTYEFTLTEETEVAILVMNNKKGNGASFLVDDVILTTADGGATGGGNEEGGEEEGGDEPETPAAGGEYLNETFATDLGAFKTQEVIGNFPWVFAANYGAKASGFSNGASQNAESWLISPAMNLTGETAANIAFDYVINKGDINAAAANHKLLVTSNYTGDVTTTEWTEVEYGAVNNNNWTFHNTGEIALPGSVMDKANVVVAFKYMSTTANSSTWEVKNVVVSSATK